MGFINMTSQEKDRYICEKLVIHWHEYQWRSGSTVETYFSECSCGHKTHFIESQKKNPDFTSEAGRVQLLKLISKRPDFLKFLSSTYVWLVKSDAVTAHWADMFLDDTGKFRDAVFKWIGGEG